jgi:hypothetical protein
MHYLIFIPNKIGPNKNHLKEVGLPELVQPGDSPALWADLIGRGPGDQPGQIWTWGDQIPAYLPDQQTWVEDKKGRYWYGFSTSSPPTPTDLLRQNPIDGVSIELADGHKWTVPNVTRLPAVFDLDDQDEPVMLPHPRFRAFAEECGWALEVVTADLQGGVSPDWKRSLDFAAMALSQNYRLNRSIAIRLGMLSEATVPQVLMQAVDVPKLRLIMEDLKKKEAASIESGLVPSNGEKV